jgi:hypothetical protein
MTRWVLVIAGLGLAAMAAPSGAQACALPHALVATQVGRVRLNRHVLNVAALSIPAADAEDHSRLIVSDARCRVLWTATVDGLENRFDVRRLGGEDVLQFVSLEPAGDGTGFTHRLLAFRGRGPRLVAQFRHTGKDGFYLGPLVRGGEGVATWVADASGESEASPHPYVVSTWTWRAGRLVGPAHYETSRKYLASDRRTPRSDVVAREIGLPYRDQTGLKAFMEPEKVMSASAARLCAGASC